MPANYWVWKLEPVHSFQHEGCSTRGWPVWHRAPPGEPPALGTECFTGTCHFTATGNLKRWDGTLKWWGSKALRVFAVSPRTFSGETVHFTPPTGAQQRTAHRTGKCHCLDRLCGPPQMPPPWEGWQRQLPRRAVTTPGIQEAHCENFIMLLLVKHTLDTCKTTPHLCASVWEGAKHFLPQNCSKTTKFSLQILPTLSSCQMWSLKNKAQNTLPKYNSLLKNKTPKTCCKCQWCRTLNPWKSEGATSRMHAHQRWRRGAHSKISGSRDLRVACLGRETAQPHEAPVSTAGLLLKTVTPTPRTQKEQF